MKKQAMAVALCITLAALLLCGCTQSGVQAAANSELLHVNAILPHNDDGYWSDIQRGMDDMLATTPYVSVKTLYPAENYNVEQMTDLIWRSIYSKVDVIVTQGNDDAAFVAALQAAVDANIAVVLVDTDLAGFARTAYIGTNNYAAGQQLAQKVVVATGGNAKVGVLIGDDSFPNMKQRLQAVQDTFAAYSGIEICTVMNDEYSAARVLLQYEEMRQNYPQVDTLVCLEGTGLSALSDVFLTEAPTLHVFGFDLTQGQSDVILRAGLIDGFVVQDTYGMGVECVNLLETLRTEGTVQNSLHYTASYYLTQSNLDEYLEKGAVA